MLGCEYSKHSNRPTLEARVPFVVGITRNLRRLDWLFLTDKGWVRLECADRCSHDHDGETGLPHCPQQPETRHTLIVLAIA